MNKNYLQVAALLAALSVALGAFGAHGLKSIVSEQSLITYETGVRYQFYHVFALFITGILYREQHAGAFRIAYWLFITGIILFSGSLYLLAVLAPEYRFLGAITPFGGVAFIAGWVQLMLAVRKKD
jgi:uncharacterized membrane protein YgdD (TMEM256/DUF423 family)